MVARCCRLKADVVEQDEREETGLRAVLNYGHTFAHAFETLAGYGTLLHGEAVAIGMLCASRLAERLGRVDEQFTARQRELLVALGLPVEVPIWTTKRSLPPCCTTRRRNTAGFAWCCRRGWATSSSSTTSIPTRSARHCGNNCRKTSPSLHGRATRRLLRAAAPLPSAHYSLRDHGGRAE